MDQESAKKPTRFFGVSRNVISMGVVSFLNDLSSDMIFPFIPIFLTSVLGAGAAFVGLVEGLADATASVLKILSGRISDRMLVRKPFVVGGYGLSAITKPLLAFAMAPWHVLAVRFIDRVGKGMRDAPRDALLSLSTDKASLGRAFGFHRAFDTLGGALGPLLAFVILPYLHNDLRSLFLLSFVASAFSVVILFFFVREVQDGLKNEAVRFEFKYLGVPFTIFIIAATVFALGKASDAFLILRGQSAGIALALLPILYFTYSITFAIFSTPAGIIADKLGHRNTYMIGMLVFSATYFLFSYATTPQAVWSLFILYGFYSALTEGVGRAIVADLIAPAWRGTAYGIYNACTGLALLPASLVFGYLWQFVSPKASFHYGATLGLMAFAIFLFLRARNHERAAV